MSHSIRVFISYSHADLAVVERLVEVLEEDGVTVLWSKKLAVGSGFDEQLKVFIEHAHVFMPVITESSSTRGWVHHEIGYAMALHIPVFPVIIGNFAPEGMLQTKHAIKLKNDLSDLKQEIGYESLNDLLRREAMPALYQRAAVVEERAAMMKSYADKVAGMGKFGQVRQKGGLSSFHIPMVHIENQVWTDRYYPEKRGSHHKELQLGERKALQQHAGKEGCLLIINPMYVLDGRSDLAAKTRLKTLINFLTGLDPEKNAVAIRRKPGYTESLTIVGDWFLAESVSFRDGDGYTNTFFTRNAAEIARRIHTFDEELDDLLAESGWTRSNSCSKTIMELEKVIEGIGKK